jgi:DNA-binding transcriptional LysR family regulator
LTLSPKIIDESAAMIRELSTLVAVARHGTFAAAGAQIGLTQSAVSAQMQRLEADLGYALFDRTGRSATLNDAGRETLALAAEILALVGRLHDRNASPHAAGSVSIGAIASVQTSFLADALAAFRREWSGWKVRIVPGVSLGLLGQVDAGELDCAVLIKPPFALPAELDGHTLAKEPFVVLAPAAFARRSWRDALAALPFIRYDRRSFGGGQVDRFLRRMRIDVDDAIELDELQAIVQLVARGLGAALLPLTPGLGKLPRSVAPLELGDDAFYREIVLVERKRREMPAALRQLAQCIKDAAVHADADRAGRAPSR